MTDLVFTYVVEVKKDGNLIGVIRKDHDIGLMFTPEEGWDYGAGAMSQILAILNDERLLELSYAGNV